MCQIILKSIHKYGSSGPDICGRTDGRTYTEETFEEIFLFQSHFYRKKYLLVSERGWGPAWLSGKVFDS